MVPARDSPAFSNVSRLQDELIVVLVHASERLLSLILVLCIVSWISRLSYLAETDYCGAEKEKLSSGFALMMIVFQACIQLMHVIVLYYTLWCVMWWLWLFLVAFYDLHLAWLLYEMVNMHLVYMWWETDCSTGCFLNDV